MRNRIHRQTLAGAGSWLTNPPEDLRALRRQVMATWDELFGDVAAEAAMPVKPD
jgi:[glutamine synthetase] adenylyltransferase / [glutamine synthetase]-adenylyl-L-tyrosine phosphorylase